MIEYVIVPQHTLEKHVLILTQPIVRCFHYFIKYTKNPNTTPSTLDYNESEWTSYGKIQRNQTIAHVNVFSLAIIPSQTRKGSGWSIPGINLAETERVHLLTSVCYAPSKVRTPLAYHPQKLGTPAYSPHDILITESSESNRLALHLTRGRPFPLRCYPPAGRNNRQCYKTASLQ
jgi:hypothetical protein